MDFWSCLIDCFTNNGDWNALKRACINHGVQEAITRDLSELRSALAEAASAFEAASADDPSAREIATVFRALRALISVGDSCTFPTWRSIHKILDLPASMEDLATVKMPASVNGARMGGSQGLSNSYSLNNLPVSIPTSTPTLTPGRSYQNINMLQSPPISTPGTIVRGVSVATDLTRVATSSKNDLVGPQSPATARRQASVVRDLREGGAPNGSSTNRMLSMVSSGSPMCSPRRPAVLVDPRLSVASRNTAREPFSGSWAGEGYVAQSPPGPSRGLIREASVANQRSRSALVPSNPAYGIEFQQQWRPMDTPNSVVRATSTAYGQSGSVNRGTSVVSPSIPEGGRGSSAVTSAAGGMVTVMTQNSPSPSPPEFGSTSPSQVIRGKSMVTSPSNFKRSHSPLGRGGSSVVIETMMSSRGPSMAGNATQRASNTTLEPPPMTSRRIGEVTLGPSPSQGRRTVMPYSQPAQVLSARQWNPYNYNGFATSGSEHAAGGSSVVMTVPSGLGTGDSSTTTMPMSPAAFSTQMFGTKGSGGMLYS